MTSVRRETTNRREMTAAAAYIAKDCLFCICRSRRGQPLNDLEDIKKPPPAPSTSS